MIRLLCFGVLILSALFVSPLHAQSDSMNRQLYEVRSYMLGDSSDGKAIDQYLRDALLPALARQGIGPVGAFTNAPQDETGSRRIIVVIPYSDANQMLGVSAKLASDETYQASAKEYLSRDPKQAPYQRINSELLVAMDCFPTAKVPSGTLENQERVYELRLYESPNERLGALKVDMFNNGEVPIFLDCDIQPLFIGQAVVGPQTPSLTYLTVYKNDAAREEAWKAFRAHPDWKILSAEAKYQGTVSRIDKFVLQAKPYSQM